MRRDDLENEYFEWLHDEVCDKNKRKYRKLLYKLHERAFETILPLDENRASDGVDLRYRFGYENSYAEAIIASYLDTRECSILEMMVALVMRIEEHIMDNPELGNRTSIWFWDMINNMGLSDMTDDRFDRRYVDERIDIMLNRTYGRNGEGGLFTIKNRNEDIRNVEIWYQMMWHLNDVIRKEDK